MSQKTIDKIILAYSGGLDTTVILHWLKKTYDAEVIVCCLWCTYSFICLIAVLCDECSFFTRKLADGVTFCLQQGSPSQVESDEEDHAADKRLLAEYDDDPVKAEQE